MEIKLGKRVPCEVEHNWYAMQAPFVLREQNEGELPRFATDEEAGFVDSTERKSQKQKEQYRSYVTQKLDETWIEQADEDGNIFFDKFLHPQCEYITNIKKDGTTTN